MKVSGTAGYQPAADWQSALVGLNEEPSAVNNRAQDDILPYDEEGQL